VLITGLMRYYFHDSPPSSFADVYLAGVLVLAYRYSWKLAAALAGASLLLTVYLLVPLDNADRFEIASYTVTAAVILYVTAALRRRRA
jgi:K+-sensing histidine kinase KdpD